MHLDKDLDLCENHPQPQGPKDRTQFADVTADEDLVEMLLTRNDRDRQMFLPRRPAPYFSVNDLIAIGARRRAAVS
jgi:hypothetical protein